MIRLALLTGSVRVPSRVYPGVAYTLRRLRSPQMEAAASAAQAAVRDLAKGGEVLAAYGLTPQDLGNGAPLDLSDLEAVAGVGVIIGAVEVLMRALVAWEGVEAVDGAAAEITRANLAVLVQDYRERAHLLAEVDAAARVLIVEKKGSRPSPDGSTATRPRMAEGQATAPGAPKRARPAPKGSPDAPEGSVRKPSTRR